MQRAFDNFWDNAEGPDGVPLQTHYGTALATVAAEVADEPSVLGYDTMNEPWPGTDWEPCVTGCPEIEQARLAPFAARMTAAIGAVDPDGFVFSEPFVLFNFGQGPTSVSGYAPPDSGLSFHVYALSPEADEATIDFAPRHRWRRRPPGHRVRRHDRRGDPRPADRSPRHPARAVDLLGLRRGPDHRPRAAADAGQHPRAGAAGAGAPYATATNGLPVVSAYDPSTATFDYRFETVGPDGLAAPVGITTVVAMTPAAYPGGYTVEITAAVIVPASCRRPVPPNWCCATSPAPPRWSCG